mmetsp:Transcript_18687/g.38811  ORF Transcript_18687/g.38811 Transcript_18687/m.38811 type:complete len:492 (+) Transcript_18687:59-1534(+)
MDTPDLLINIFQFLGPRHSIIGLGSSARHFREISQSDELWRFFWECRCLFPRGEENCNNTCIQDLILSSQQSREEKLIHDAAKLFRHSIISMGLEDVFLSQTSSSAFPRRDVSHGFNKGNIGGDIKATEVDATSSHEEKSTSDTLYLAYVQVHQMMKRTNLRVGVNGDVSDYDLRQLLCTQTWPGQLSLLGNNRINHDLNRENDDDININNIGRDRGGREMEENLNHNRNNNNLITCLNPAETWCDHPSCTQARCGTQGCCLRLYRFLPGYGYAYGVGSVINGNVATGTRVAEVTARNVTTQTATAKNVSFIPKCNWCSVSFCSEHIKPHFYQIKESHLDYPRDERPLQLRNSYRKRWFTCHECKKSSCPDCIGEIFPSIPNPNGCKVVSAGKVCGRMVCGDCTWFVGREKRRKNTGNECNGDKVSCAIPGGTIRTDPQNVRVERGINGLQALFITEWEDVEQCCSRCLRHVEFRRKELIAVENSFGGLIP